MGFKNDHVDVELAPKDLLTCWGHDFLEKNLDLFFSVIVEVESKRLDSGGQRCIVNGAALLEESL